MGVFTIGLKSYFIDSPTILFIHPNDVISWRNLSDVSAGYYCLFQKSLIAEDPIIKASIDKYGLFADKSKSVITLNDSDIDPLNDLFVKMQAEEVNNGFLRIDAMTAYLQLIMVHCSRIKEFMPSTTVNGELEHVYHFFEILENETSNIRKSIPIRTKTAKEFAAQLSLHPNYLNALLKKHTGQTVSTHITGRFLEESKILLLQTDWSLGDISYSLGFSDAPNFYTFFKKNTGINPSEFRNHRSLLIPS
ncbi:MAG: helix-turn-helix transcriptional regulator [Paludibacter sp.]|nr:helix-turn-helix transcriptional regulator [Paludibacter sp.]